jgi:hypothetical protein
MEFELRASCLLSRHFYWSPYSLLKLLFILEPCKCCWSIPGDCNFYLKPHYLQMNGPVWLIWLFKGARIILPSKQMYVYMLTLSLKHCTSVLGLWRLHREKWHGNDEYRKKWHLWVGRRNKNHMRLFHNIWKFPIHAFLTSTCNWRCSSKL